MKITTAEHPPTLVPRFACIPDPLTAEAAWVLWRWTWKGEAQDPRAGGWTKPPFTVDGHHASTTKAATWRPFEDVVAAYVAGGWDGVGLVLTQTNFVGIDLDDVVDPETRAVQPDALAVVRAINAYTEVSPSGRGLRIVARGTLPPGWRKTGRWRVPIEMYDRSSPRYLTITGHHLAGTPSAIEERTDALTTLHAQVGAAIAPVAPADGDGSSPAPVFEDLDDEARLAAARAAQHGDAFRRLFDHGVGRGEDHSAADLTLCNHLAFWLGRDPVRMDRAFRRSACMRSKWDERHSADGRSYGQMTIEKAIAGCRDPYTPASGSSPSSAGSGPPPLGIGGGAFLRTTYTPPRPLIEGVLSDEGGGWRGGEEKLGKSIAVLDETICLTHALPVLGRFPVPTPRRVLLVSEEDSPRRTWRRLRALLRGHALDPDDPAVQATLDARLRISAWEGFRFDDAAMVARLEATIAEFKPEVVYLDVLRKMTTRDLNKADQASAILDCLDDLRRRYGCVFIVVHHYRKSQGFRVGRGSQEIGGSYVLGAWGENSLFFEPLGRTGGGVKLDLQVKDMPPAAPLRLVIESEGPAHDPICLRVRADELTEANAGAKNRERLLDALRALTPIPAEDTGTLGVPLDALVTAVGLSDRTVRAHLALLRQEATVRLVGYIARQGKKGATKAPLWAVEAPA